MTNEEYEIATRGNIVSGWLDDGGDGFSIVSWGQYEYKVYFTAGRPVRVEKFGLSGKGEFIKWLATE
jgi:hypothetical protein